MTLQELSIIDFFQGLFTAIFVFISLFIGLRIIFFPKNRKERLNISLGLTWILLCSAWWGSSLRFFILVIFNWDIGNFFHLFLSNVFVPIALIVWVYTITSTVYLKIKKKAMLLISLICIPYDIILIILLFVNPNLIGSTKSIVDLTYTLFPQIFLLFAIITSVSTGLLFSLRSMEIPDPKIQLRGKFFFLAFLSLGVGSFFDVFLIPTLPYIIIVRFILILSSVAYYLAFFLPENIANKMTHTS